MRMKMKSINILIENLVEKDNEEYIQMLYEKERKGKNITGEYKKDSVPEEKLLKLLEKSSTDERIRCLLIGILGGEEINADCISDKIFEYCLNYPTHWKRTLLILLAHMRLKKEQLEQLNQRIETSEAFYQLYLINMRDNNLHITRFRDFLLENERHLNSLANFREHIEGQNISQEKINLTNQLVREQLEKYILTPANSMFSSLFLLNLYDDNLSVSQFREFLLENERHLSSLANFQEHIKGQSINQDKINLTNQLVRAQLEKSLFFINLYDNKFSISKFRKFMLENEEYPINLAYWWKHARKRLLRRQDICQEKIILVDQLVEKSNATAEK